MTKAMAETGHSEDMPQAVQHSTSGGNAALGAAAELVASREPDRGSGRLLHWDIEMLAGGNAETAAAMQQEIQAVQRRGGHVRELPALAYKLLKIAQASPGGNLRAFNPKTDMDKLPGGVWGKAVDHPKFGVKAAPEQWAVDTHTGKVVMRMSGAAATPGEVVALWIFAALGILFALIDSTPVAGGGLKRETDRLSQPSPSLHEWAYDDD